MAVRWAAPRFRAVPHANPSGPGCRQSPTSRTFHVGLQPREARGLHPWPMQAFQQLNQRGLLFPFNKNKVATLIPSVSDYAILWYEHTIVNNGLFKTVEK